MSSVYLVGECRDLKINGSVPVGIGVNVEGIDLIKYQVNSIMRDISYIGKDCAVIIKSEAGISFESKKNLFRNGVKDLESFIKALES